MYEYTLKREQWFPQPPGDVFPFFADAQNLAAITPPFLRFTVLTPMPLDLHEGTLLDYRLKIVGVPVNWRTRIARFDKPHAFVDTQVRGPYRLWHHTHTFEERDGATRMCDSVRYALPYGILGRAAHAVFVRRMLQRIFDYRACVLRERFGVAP